MGATTLGGDGAGGSAGRDSSVTNVASIKKLSLSDGARRFGSTAVGWPLLLLLLLLFCGGASGAATEIVLYCWYAPGRLNAAEVGCPGVRVNSGGIEANSLSVSSSFPSFSCSQSSLSMAL